MRLPLSISFAAAALLAWTAPQAAPVAQVTQVTESRIARVVVYPGSATVERVARVAAGARSLSLARTNAIGVVLPDFHGEFFSEIVRGMDREASRRGYMLLLSNVHAGSEQSENTLRAMRASA